MIKEFTDKAFRTWNLYITWTLYLDRSRYECRIKLSNVTSLRTGLISQHGSLESFVGRQVSKQLKKYLWSSSCECLIRKSLRLTIESEWRTFRAMWRRTAKYLQCECNYRMSRRVYVKARYVNGLYNKIGFPAIKTMYVRTRSFRTYCVGNVIRFSLKFNLSASIIHVIVVAMKWASRLCNYTTINMS